MNRLAILRLQRWDAVDSVVPLSAALLCPLVAVAFIVGVTPPMHVGLSFVRGAYLRAAEVDVLDAAAFAALVGLVVVSRASLASFANTCSRIVSIAG